MGEKQISPEHVQEGTLSRGLLRQLLKARKWSNEAYRILRRSGGTFRMVREDSRGQVKYSKRVRMDRMRQSLPLFPSLSHTIFYSNRDTNTRTQKHAHTHTHERLCQFGTQSLVCVAKIRHQQGHRNSIMSDRWWTKERHYSGLLITRPSLHLTSRVAAVWHWELRLRLIVLNSNP